MNRDEVLKQETIKIIERMKGDVEATAIRILDLFGAKRSKGEALTRLWWQSNAEERRVFLTLIEALTTKGVLWFLDIEKDLPETQE